MIDRRYLERLKSWCDRMRGGRWRQPHVTTSHASRLVA
jgi:hypothetical protein